MGPANGGFLEPVKASVRESERLELGATVRATLTLNGALER